MITLEDCIALCGLTAAFAAATALSTSRISRLRAELMPLCLATVLFRSKDTGSI
jgi:hypothetical protein